LLFKVLLTLKIFVFIKFVFWFFVISDLTKIFDFKGLFVFSIISFGWILFLFIIKCSDFIGLESKSIFDEYKSAWFMNDPINCKLFCVIILFNFYWIKNFTFNIGKLNFWSFIIIFFIFVLQIIWFFFFAWKWKR